MQGLYTKYLTEEFDSNGVLTNMSLNAPDDFNFAFDVVDEYARTCPDHLAMTWVGDNDEERTFTFADIKRESDKTAAFLQQQGIKKGDFVMLILKRHYEFWFAYIALHKIGAIAVPATCQLLVKDLVYRFNAAKIKGVICTSDGDVSDYVDEACKQCPTVEVKVITRKKKDGWLSYEELQDSAPEFIKPTGADYACGKDPLFLYFSSGTTGMPKMVIHNHFYPLGHITTAKHWQNVIPGKLHLSIAETGWGKAIWGKLYGQWFMLTPVFVYDFDRFDAHKMLQKIADYKVATLCCPPTMYRFFIHEDLSQYDLSNLTYAVTAGEALNPEVYEKFLAATGLKLREAFGQTETTATLGTFSWMEPKPGSMGKPNMQYEIALVDDDGNEVPNGENGMISIRTSNKKPIGMFDGYYNDQAMTDKVWYDGLYRTGDIAWKDEDGYFWYVGRGDDIIKSSGYRIGPFEVESVLMEHKAVLECAVTGVPDPLRGFAVKATIVLVKGYTPSDDLTKDIQNYVKTHTAPYKYPRIVEFVDELPKTISGKVRRVDIRNNDNNKQNN